MRGGGRTDRRTELRPEGGGGLNGSVSSSPRGVRALKAKSQVLTSPDQPFPVAEVMDEREREGEGEVQSTHHQCKGLDEKVYTLIHDSGGLPYSNTVIHISITWS